MPCEGNNQTEWLLSALVGHVVPVCTAMVWSGGWDRLGWDKGTLPYIDILPLKLLQSDSWKLYSCSFFLCSVDIRECLPPTKFILSILAHSTIPLCHWSFRLRTEKRQTWLRKMSFVNNSKMSFMNNSLCEVQGNRKKTMFSVLVSTNKHMYTALTFSRFHFSTMA